MSSMTHQAADTTPHQSTQPAPQPSHIVVRQCEVVLENGDPCRGIPALGQTCCHAHRRFRQAGGQSTLLVPLLNDQASITFVISQTVRAMALGTIPPANGRVMLAGCRQALQSLDRRLEQQKIALRYSALAAKIGEQKLQSHMAEFMDEVSAPCSQLLAHRRRPTYRSSYRRSYRSTYRRSYRTSRASRAARRPCPRRMDA